MILAGQRDTATTRHDAPPAHAALGNTEIKGNSEVTATNWRAHLWALQAAMWAVTEDKTLAGCGRWAAPHAAHVGMQWNGPGAGGRFTATQRSNSVWASPLCSVSICQGRKEELSQALTNWVKTPGHSVVFLTLTLRHRKGQGLTKLWSALADCWKATTNGTPEWKRPRSGDKARYRIAHTVRTVEVTHGKNGWHPHMHAALLVERPLASDEVETLRTRLFTRWANRAEKLGLVAPSDAHGIDIQQLAQGEDAATVAGYLTKGMLSSLSSEVTGGAMKSARGGNRTPFQVLESIAAAQARGESPAAEDVQVWREWERASKGRRQLVWSRGAKAALEVEERPASELVELAEAAEDTDNAQVVAIIARPEWAKIQSNVKARLEVAEAVGAAMTPAQAQAAALDVLARHGVQASPVAVAVKLETTDLRAHDSARYRAEVRAEARL